MVQTDTGGSQAKTAQLTGSLGEPIKMSAMGPRLSTEEPMRNSAEAYLKGSLDVSSSASVSVVWQFVNNFANILR